MAVLEHEGLLRQGDTRGAVFHLSLWTPEFATSVHLTINAPYRCVQALEREASLFSSVSFL